MNTQSPFTSGCEHGSAAIEIPFLSLPAKPTAQATKPSSPVAVENHLLDTLALLDKRAVVTQARPISLVEGQILQHAGEKVLQVYFPLQALLVLTMPLTDGRAGEVALIGNSGLFGAQVLLGETVSPVQVMVAVAGSALSLSVANFRLECQRREALRSLIHKYLLFQFAEILQSVTCNKLHSLNQRLSRWLLTLGEYQQGTYLPITHEFLSHLLGVRRAGITKALQELAADHLLSCHRRHIAILNYRALTQHACECYNAIERERSLLFGAQDRK